MSCNADRPSRFGGHQYPQVIPVPDEIRRGGPAPWADLSESERSNLSLSLVLGRLREQGRTFDVASIPAEPREMAGVAESVSTLISRRSAVLVGLFEEEGETHVILTRRSFQLRSHRGEIAFPGGRVDGAETFIEAALREAQEEVGLEPSLVDPVAWLNPIVTFASGSAMWPVVGVLEGRPTMVADPDEVERVFTVALADLLKEGAFVEERWRRELQRPGSDTDGFFPIYFFQVPGDVVWGATARVLTELLCAAVGVVWPDASRVWA